MVTRECAECGSEHMLIRGTADYAQAARCACHCPCPACGDVGHHFECDENGYQIARPCTCLALDRRVAWLNAARLPARYAAASFVSFQAPDLPRRNARVQASRFASEFEDGDPGILFYGHCGTGKTHLLVAILRHLVVKRGVPVRYIEFMHLLSELRATFGDSGRAEDVMAPLVAVPVLAVDELGKGRGSDWELTVLDEVISKRYNAGRTTLFASNYFPGPATEGQQSLADRVGERIYSRLSEMCHPQHMAGEDFRRRR